MKPRLVFKNFLWICYLSDELRVPLHVTAGRGATPREAYANFKINLAKSQSNVPGPPFGPMYTPDSYKGTDK